MLVTFRAMCAVRALLLPFCISGTSDTARAHIATMLAPAQRAEGRKERRGMEPEAREGACPSLGEGEHNHCGLLRGEKGHAW